MTSNPLDQPASVTLVQEWRQQGHLSAEIHAELMSCLRPVKAWRAWGSRCFLVLGVVLLLSGVVFFFAWNWDSMPRWQRLSLPVGGVLLPALGSLFLGADGLGRKMALLAASIMIGVFVAVFGQEYQTGADAYGLFVLWATLALAWVLSAGFAALWCVWLAIVTTAIVTWWAQAGVASEGVAGEWQACLLAVAALYAAALLLKESLAPRFPWLRERWFRLWLLLALILPLCGYTCGWIVVGFDDDQSWTVAAVWLIAAGLCFAAYRWKWQDSAAMAVALSSVGAVVVTAVARGLWEVMEDLDNSGVIFLAFLFFCSIIGSLMGGIVWVLRKVAVQMAEVAPASPTVESVGAPPLVTASTKRGDAVSITWREALGVISGDEAVRLQIEEQISTLAAKPREPAWLKVVSTLGAWMAAWTFMPMLWWVLVLITQAETEGPFVIGGLIVLSLCVWLSRRTGESTFLRQMNLALALGAVGLILGGVISWQSDARFDHLCLVQVIIAAITYPLYRDPAYRFLIVVSSTSLITLWLTVDSDKVSGALSPWISLVAVVTTWLWSWRARPAALNPLALASAFSLGALVIYQSVISEFPFLPNIHIYNALTAWVLGAGVLFLICALNRGRASLTSPWVIGVAIIAAALAWQGEAGVLTAVLLGVAGYAWGDKLVSVFAWVFLGGFLFFLYYSLHVPLSWKSAVIGGTGVALLILRWILNEITRRENSVTSVS